MGESTNQLVTREEVEGANWHSIFDGYQFVRFPSHMSEQVLAQYLEVPVITGTPIDFDSEVRGKRWEEMTTLKGKKLLIIVD